MGLENLQKKLEELESIELATVEVEKNKKGTILYLTLSEEYNGKGDSVVNTVLDEIPRDFLPINFKPETHLSVYYDAIEIKL
jgi:hypothetical protein